MKFTLTIEHKTDEDGPIWEARIAEFPDVCGFEDTAYEAACVAIDAAICLTEDADSIPAGCSAVPQDAK